MDDGLCEYPEENFDCDGNCIVDVDCFGDCGGDAYLDPHFGDNDCELLGIGLCLTAR